MKWTRLSCCSFAANAVRLQLHALGYNLANFMGTLALPEAIAHWSLTSLREKLVKRHVPDGRGRGAKDLFSDILRLIAELRPPPTAAPA
jgi:hypothetical protein